MRITDEDLKMFKERSKTELKSGYDISRLAWDDVVPALCNEIAELRKKLNTVQQNSASTAD